MESKCKGCLSLSQGGRCASNHILQISETEQCPCIDCVVKIMCLDTCEEFKAYNIKCIKINQFKKAIKNGKRM